METFNCPDRIHFSFPSPNPLLPELVPSLAFLILVNWRGELFYSKEMESQNSRCPRTLLLSQKSCSSTYEMGGDWGLFIQRVGCIRHLKQQITWTTMRKHFTTLTERNPVDCQIQHDPYLCFPCFSMSSMNRSTNSSRPDESSLSEMWKM